MFYAYYNRPYSKDAGNEDTDVSALLSVRLVAVRPHFLEFN